MGAWDTGNFSNDSALDYVDELENSDQIVTSLRSARPGMDADEAARVLAACDLVAAMLGRPAADMPDECTSLLAKASPPDAGLLDAARQSLAIVREGSELAELWGEDPEQEADWHATLDDLLTRLDPEQPYKAPQPARRAADIGGHCFICHTSGSEAEIVALTHDYDDGVVCSSMTLYAHRVCVETRFSPPHWTAEGGPANTLLAQFGAMLEEDLNSGS